MMEMKIQRLNEVIGTNEIFKTIMTNYTLPWSEDETITDALLDFEYINNYSGRKIISPAVGHSLGDDGKITAVGFQKLCDICYMMFNKKWTRNWTILNMEYNPIENYAMNEHTVLTRDNKESHSGTDSNVRTGSVGVSASSSGENKVSAFNSSEYQPADSSTGSGSNTTTFNNLTDAETHGHIIDNDDTETTDHTRTGNIGVTTSQQMAESDLQLWRWNFFYEVFADIDNVFTVSTY